MTHQQLWEAVQEHGSIRAAGRALGMPESTLRMKLKGYNPELPEHAFIPDADNLPATHVDEGGVETEDFWATQIGKPGVRRYILTSAQNNCQVHEGFLTNLKALAKSTGAKLLVSFSIYDRQGYRGLTRAGDTSIKKNEVWWDRAVEPYSTNNRCLLHRRLSFCGELDVLATAKDPLSGLESYCGRSSIIIPHNRFSFRCVESRKHQMPKEMFTTGSVTHPRFIQRKTGQVAHFHHVVGALLVEVTDEGFWHVHHLNAKEDGSFYWLDKLVSGGTVKKSPYNISALILGDVHHEKLNRDQSIIVTEDIIPTLSPVTVVVHDLIDFTSRNHHNRDNALFRVAVGNKQVASEVNDAGTWLDSLCELVDSVIVVRSNHDEALNRWIRDVDWRDDPMNAAFYLDVAQEAVGQAEQGKTPRQMNLLQWAIQHHFQQAPGALFLDLDESYEIEGIEVGVHGHVGPTGTRGTPRGFSRLGFKTFTAHTHSPSIVDGCYTVGVLGKLNMDYNVGPSKWMHCHGIIYPNGKRAFLQVKNGRWRA